MALPFVVAGSAPGFATEVSVAKQNTTPYCILNSAGVTSPAPVLGASVAVLPAVPAINAGVPGTVSITNPVQGPGTYALLVEFGSTGAAYDVSTTCYYGKGFTDAPTAPLRWLGGAVSSIITGSAPDSSIQLTPSADGTAMTIENWSAVALNAGGTVTAVQLSGAIPGL